ncbi:MAG: hypothetical protein J6D03_11275 [Clostridia bacterium]|nr:hypothetical protein [Clostridia bacterium]
MNKKILVITGIIMILLANLSVCFASSDLRIVEKEYTVDYKMADEFYNSIEKNIIEDKVGYELNNIERKDNFKTLTREKEIIEEKVTNTNNLEEVIKLFNDTKDIEEDSYVGILKRDNSSLKVEIKDSYQEEYKVYLQKNYDNVSSNELNDIPKKITQNGTTYYLVNPVWNVAKTENISNGEVPVKYDGIMYYEGIKTKTIITSYLATIKYDGVLEKEVPNTTTFTVTYKEVKEYGNIVSAIAGTTGFIFVSGIVLLNLKNVKIYNLQNGEYKLVKKLHLNKDKKLFINLTPTKKEDRIYKIVLAKSLYKSVKGKNIKIKYYDRQQNYNIQNREFEVMI